MALLVAMSPAAGLKALKALVPSAALGFERRRASIGMYCMQHECDAGLDCYCEDRGAYEYATRKCICCNVMIKRSSRTGALSCPRARIKSKQRPKAPTPAPGMATVVEPTMRLALGNLRQETTESREPWSWEVLWEESEGDKVAFITGCWKKPVSNWLTQRSLSPCAIYTHSLDSQLTFPDASLRSLGTLWTRRRGC